MRVALVTGAAGGIGAAIARRLAGEGRLVVAAVRSRMDAVAALVREIGGLAVACDLARPDGPDGQVPTVGGGYGP